MSIYTGTTCPYCNKKIEENDEVIVCPECGTPHHRACYLEHGACANADKHEAGFEWVDPDKKEQISSQQGQYLPNQVPAPGARPEGSIYCQKCDKLNNRSNRFCNYCGAPLQPALNEQKNTDRRFFTDIASQQAQFDPEEKIDGIPIRDWTTYIGRNVYFYLYSFKVQDRTKRRITFSFAAMFIPFFYFMYRKVYKYAFVAGLLNIILNFPAVCQYYLIPSGVSVPIPSSTLATLSTVCAIIGFAIQLFWGLFGVWLYRRESVKRMTALHMSSSSEEEYASKLALASGPSYKGILIFFGVYLALMILNLLLTM